jgi:hypothetical protein
MFYAYYALTLSIYCCTLKNTYTHNASYIYDDNMKAMRCISLPGHNDPQERNVQEMSSRAGEVKDDGAHIWGKKSCGLKHKPVTRNTGFVSLGGGGGGEREIERGLSCP